MERGPSSLIESHRRAVLYNWLFFVDLVIFAAAVEFIRFKFHPYIGHYAHGPFFRVIFYGFSFVHFFLIGFIANLFLVKENIESREVALDQLKKSNNAALVSCELVALLGFILFLVWGYYLDFYAFLFLSLFCWAVYFPKRHQWYEWLAACGFPEADGPGED